VYGDREKAVGVRKRKGRKEGKDSAVAPDGPLATPLREGTIGGRGKSERPESKKVELRSMPAQTTRVGEVIPREERRREAPGKKKSGKEKKTAS